MGDTLIISDLHLSGSRPATVDLFLRFLQEQASHADHLYILGDLFDAWIGDDDDTPPIPTIIEGMRELTSKGCKLSIMQGNRDFLLGVRFAAATGCNLLPDPYVLELHDVPILLMHGDLLCTDDKEYLQARQLLRSEAFIQDFMSRSIVERLHLAAEYRKRSGEVISLKSADIMDVNQGAVEDYMQTHGVLLLIHGHTHRPAVHEFELNTETARRYVLEDWHEDSCTYLRICRDGIRQESFN
ncbi:UDP-2,3-diacylglucosamine diphosphatase [Sedimenticola selenatireducens]|uniref:UDP-2,3-diacylglucosamine hydrolase n=1 Tax=Sedimenticola selenatireducens TaxID=191960 RepID=A0A557SD33_9GAMM|nr:UDP-2,3-diacylglucosamine diphosphatase [Sedimenticola selenatireducens]TVO75313.1 UDP-2,3-diacylglucosamine diphosphatase [Sedimenticola selenatireducens]TVT66834.1 MAG: UDP-2,3-diacylglucosamine diphosphatase [Sedimenticola selenatireducens]